MDKLLEGNPIGRSIIFKKARETVDKNTGGKYPAPYGILDVVQNGLGDKWTHLTNEATTFARLAGTPESEALIGLFHGTTAVKKHKYAYFSLFYINIYCYYYFFMCLDGL